MTPASYCSLSVVAERLRAPDSSSVVSDQQCVDTIGICQRPVFSLGVSQHMQKITCENLNSIGRRSCKVKMEEKTPLTHKVVCFQMLDFGTSKSYSEVSKSKSNIISVQNYCFSFFNYVTSEGVVSHNVLFYQQLSIDCYAVRFYSNNYCE